MFLFLIFITLTNQIIANLLGKAPVTLYRDPTALARRFEISQSAVGSHENTRKYNE